MQKNSTVRDDEKAKEARRAYYREYYAKNKEKAKKYRENYWLRRAEKHLKEMQEGQKNDR